MEEKKETIIKEKLEEKKEETTEKLEEELIEERKKKLVNFFKTKQIWVFVFLIVALILGIYIRSQPLLDHGGRPGLWDIALNDYTLGPDLDPWLFTRYAKTMIEQGSLPEIDTMRNVPLGFDTTLELQMVSYMIVLTYKIVNMFGSYSVNFAAALMPVILFALTIVSFFLFVREIFARKNSEDKNMKANIIALMSTFFMIVIPVFLSRTVAGIPEKESVAFFFMFLAFYFFLKAWKTEKLKFAIILGILTGISTALMGMAWGGVGYIYIAIGTASFLAFILGKTTKKEFIIYVLWFVVSVVLLRITSERYSIIGFMQSTSNLTVTFTLFAMLIYFILLNPKIKRFLQNSKIPLNLWSVIFAIILGVVLISLFFGINFIPNKINGLIQTFIKPVTGRWSVTVAENRQPYFTEWGASFGPFIKNIPVMFWLFFIGSIVLFKSMLKEIRKKDSWILTCFYVLFLFGLIFSRYAPHPNILDGEGFVSRVFYFGSALLLIGSFIYYYVRYYREKNEGFEKIDFEFLFLFSLFVLCLFTARSAVRLIMVLGPIAPIFVSYLVVVSVNKFRKTKDETAKIVFGIVVVIILFLSIFIFWNFYKAVKSEAYNFIPSYYTQQWQKAMQWVRETTTKNSVFAHWWDYGYWVQSIGERATVTDGGNAIVWWNYLSGRLVLTGDNEKDALDFLYSHNATHLLIDSTDIGKYSAYSSIGSDANYDRYSWIPIMTYDPSQIKETKEGITRVYQGASGIDEDIHYKKQNESEISLPAQRAAIVAVIVETIQKDNSSSLKQPKAVFYYEGKQIEIPLRYVYYNKQFLDFDSGLEGTAYIIPRVYSTNQGMQIDNVGGLIYISPRVLRGMMAQIYLLNDPFNKFPNFKLVHSENSLIVDSLNQQGANLNEFTLFNDVQGPIKIWEIKYTGKEEIKQEYLDKDYFKYLNWSL